MNANLAKPHFEKNFKAFNAYTRVGLTDSGVFLAIKVSL